MSASKSTPTGVGAPAEAAKIMGTEILQSDYNTEAWRNRIKRTIDQHPQLFADLSPEATKKFLAWLPFNDHAVNVFLACSREVAAAGERTYGARGVWEAMRWQLKIRSINSADYALNNNFVGHMARLAMELDHSLNGLFKMRTGAGHHG